MTIKFRDGELDSFRVVPAQYGMFNLVLESNCHDYWMEVQVTLAFSDLQRLRAVLAAAALEPPREERE